MNAPASYWWEETVNVAALYDWLRSDQCPEEWQTLDCDDADDVSEFLHRPWKWSPEYDAFRRATTPTTRPAPETPSCRR